MAEAIVSTIAEAVVSSAVERISDLLIQKAAFLRGVTREVSRLQAELKRMQCFLKDADRKQEQDERVRNYVAEIRDLTYDAEDAIDAFLLKVASRGDGVSGFAKRVTSIFTKYYHHHQIGTEIELIRTKIADITNSMKTYGIKSVGEGESSSSSGDNQRRWRRSYPHYEEEVIVGLEDSTRDLMAQLMSEDAELRVVSVVGMGGLGKTTLAKKVYNHVDVKRHFDCYFWTFISQQFSTKDILFEILRKIVPADERVLLERMKEEELVEKLYNELKEKRYLVVLDDVWSKVAWNSLKHAFPKGKKGSKVLFTTRIKEVALYADPRSSPIEPPYFTDEEGWTLLCKKAFVDEHCFRPEFEKLGKEMVKRCGGLPLAIAVLGGLLATKKSTNEWEDVQRNINAQFIKLQQGEENYGGVYRILVLSYHDLPFHLKPCFLYFSQFPEDREIHKRELIRMWIAEGLVPQSLNVENGDKTIEDLSEEYLEELISRCMLQVSQRDHTGKGIKTCRIHDLMRDMCVSMARQDNFLEIITHREDTISRTTNSRRIAIHHRVHLGNAGERSYFLTSEDSDSHCRSLVYFAVKEDAFRITRHQGKFIFKNFRLLRLLNLWYVSIGHIPREIGNLIHLRYLGLRTGSSIKLPRSIGNMRSLYTLDLRDNSRVVLPNVLWKLECLRHLLLVVNYNQFRVDTLRNLETLKWIEIKNLISRDALLKLTNLRTLKVSFDRTEEVEVVLDSPIFTSGSLRSLTIWSPTGNSLPNLQPISHCLRLTKLELKGEIPQPEDRNHSLEFLPASLVKLVLRGSYLKQDPMVVLHKLPNLRFLVLRQAYRGSQMVCPAHGFPQLETLKLENLCYLNQWLVEEGAMPCLKTLHMEELEKLVMIPGGLKSVTTLRELNLVAMPKAFVRRVEGEDFEKVKHIPAISFTNEPKLKEI